MAATRLGKVAAMREASGWGTRFSLTAKKRLEGNGMDEGVVIAWSPALATSVAEVLAFFLFLVSVPEPATHA